MDNLDLATKIKTLDGKFYKYTSSFFVGEDKNEKAVDAINDLRVDTMNLLNEVEQLLQKQREGNKQKDFEFVLRIIGFDIGWVNGKGITNVNELNDFLNEHMQII